ncbi:MAG: heparinase II/III family protein [Actinomycetia bacterium]|nr:heparinase II/III family protein [Actinomycetes bacterium]MCH9801180.1 heparinase II/III family protein [Actinomycetes bacterium]
MNFRIKAALVAAAAAAVIPWGSGQATAAPDQGNALGKKSEWTAPAEEARDLLIQTIGDDLPQHPYCRRPLERLDLMINSSDFVWPSTLTILGETQQVDINTMNLLAGPFQDKSRQVWFSSGIWLAWRAAVFAENGQPNEAVAAARAVVAAMAKNPDPGAATPEALAAAKELNWGAGIAWRRSEALLCLTSVLPLAEVEPLLRMHANVFVDPIRYPGPPNNKLNNGGLLINLHLLDIADVLQDASYREVAMTRLSTEFPQVFSGTGFSYEASSHYHGVNYLGWTEAMFALQNAGRTAEAAALSEILTRALNAAAHFIGPTGEPLLYGNTRATDALLRPEVDVNRPLTLVDPNEGTAFGRKSWSNKKTTAWSAVNRPALRTHGHQDALSVTWQTGGVPILVDVGQPMYDMTRPVAAWSSSQIAHNTAVAAGQEKYFYRGGELRHRAVAGADLVSMKRETRDTTQQRQALFDDRRRTLTVADSSNRRLTQYWHFSPDWSAGAVNGNQIQLTHSTGQKLTVTTTKKATITVTRGSLEPFGGWYAKDFDTPIPTTQLAIAGGKAIDTQFVLGEAPAPGVAKMTRRSTELNGKLKYQWQNAKQGKTAAGKKVPKITGYRLQMQRKGELWRTIDMNSPANRLANIATDLENGVKHRFRVAALSKKGQSLFSKPTKWAIPHTTPGAIAMKLGLIKGEGAKQKAQLKWLAPENDGGAKVTGYEVKLKKGDWQRNKRTSTKILMPKKRQVLWIRAVNRAGGGDAFKVKLKRNKAGELLVNGENLAPQPPPEPTPAPTAPTPAPTPPPAPAPPPAA